MLKMFLSQLCSSKWVAVNGFAIHLGFLLLSVAFIVTKLKIIPVFTDYISAIK